MREIWSTEPRLVEEEVVRLIASAAPLLFCQKGQPPRRLVPAEIQPRKTYKMLLLRKEGAFTSLPVEGQLLYRPPGAAVHGFQATPILETEEELGVPLPHAIFWLQRRKHPRYLTSKTNSHATFARRGSNCLNHGVVEDLSLEGARVVGLFSEHIREGDLLLPLSLTLRLRIGHFEEKITAAEAIVRRIRVSRRQERELGIHFTLLDSERYLLESYLAMRAVECTVSRVPSP